MMGICNEICCKRFNFSCGRLTEPVEMSLGHPRISRRPSLRKDVLRHNERHRKHATKKFSSRIVNHLSILFEQASISSQLTSLPRSPSTASLRYHLTPVGR